MKKLILLLLLFTGLRSYAQLPPAGANQVLGIGWRHLLIGSDTSKTSYYFWDPTEGSGAYHQFFTASQTLLNTKAPFTITVNFPKSYIADATTANVRNTEGDVMVIPQTGLYFAAYVRFNRGQADAGASTIVGRFSTDTTGNSWGDEIIISTNIGTENVGSVSLYRNNDTTIRCFFGVKNGASDLRYYSCLSLNNGITWGAATQIISDGTSNDVLNSVVHNVNSGRIIIPVSTTPTTGPTNIWSEYAFYSDDGGGTWTKSNVVTPSTALGGVEPCIVQLSGDSLLMTMRTQSGFAWFSNSTDNGATWGTPYQSTLPSIYAPTQIINIGGKLVAFCNPNVTDNIRNPLSVYKSLDKGVTWTFVTNIEAGNKLIYNYAYTSLTISNGYLLVSYWEYIPNNSFRSQKFTKIKITDLTL